MKHQYALNLGPALMRYCCDGRIEIDDSAAERAAAMYSLIGYGEDGCLRYCRYTDERCPSNLKEPAWHQGRTTTKKLLYCRP